jgi:hypothetical protein
MQAYLPLSLCTSNTDVLTSCTLCACSANKRVMLVVVGVALLAAANAMLVPISMEAAVQVSRMFLVMSHPYARITAFNVMMN